LVGWLFFVFCLLTAFSPGFHVQSSQPANQPTFRAKPTAAQRFSRLAGTANLTKTANLQSQPFGSLPSALALS
jgi:hypothetical protein